MPEFTGRLRTPRLAVAPSAPVGGEMYYDTALNGLYYWNLTSWIGTAGAGFLPIDSVVTAATRLQANKLLAGDTQPAYRRYGDGKHEWGPGGTTAPDTNLYRASANILQTDDSFYSKLDIASMLGAAGQIALGSDGKIYFGSAADTNLYRSAANQLKTDGSLKVTTFLQVAEATSNAVELGVDRLGGSQAQINFGSAADVNLYRSAADNLKTDDTFWALQMVSYGGTYYLGSALDTTLSRVAAGIIKATSSLRAKNDVTANADDNGGFTANTVAIGHSGSGFAPSIIFGVADTNLYRSAANHLKTDGSFHAGYHIYVDEFNGGGRIYFGSALDTSLYRWVASVLLTNAVLGSNAGGVLALMGTAYTAGNGWMGGYFSGGLRWDGTNWINDTMGGNNGWAMWATYGAAGGMAFFTEPASGGTTRTYTPAQMQSLMKFAFDTSGKMYIGQGVTGDTQLWRSSASDLRTNGRFVAGGQIDAGTEIVARSGSATQMVMGYIGAGFPGLVFGTPQDVNLYRKAAEVLGTDDTFFINNGGVLALNNGNGTGGQIELGYNGSYRGYRHLITSSHDGGGSTGNRIEFRPWYLGLASDAISAVTVFSISGDGKVYFGNALDVTLYRALAGTLKTDGQFYAIGQIVANYATAYQIQLSPSGQITFGTAGDTNLYRSAANALMTDDWFQIGAVGNNTLEAGFILSFRDVVSARQVMCGPPDSGGAGYRSMRVYN